MHFFQRKCFQMHFFKENAGILIQISQQVVPGDPTDNKIAVVNQKCFGSKEATSHYLNQCWGIINWTLRHKLQWNFIQNYNIFIQENVLESVVCEMASILSRPQCVNSLRPDEGYVHPRLGSALLVVMACCLFSAKPLPRGPINK